MVKTVQYNDCRVGHFDLATLVSASLHKFQARGSVEGMGAPIGFGARSCSLSDRDLLVGW